MTFRGDIWSITKPRSTYMYCCCQKVNSDQVVTDIMSSQGGLCLIDGSLWMDVVSMFRDLGRIVINNTRPRQGAVLRGRCEWHAVPKPHYSLMLRMLSGSAYVCMYVFALRISISASPEFSHDFITYRHTYIHILHAIHTLHTTMHVINTSSRLLSQTHSFIAVLHA